jgi:hypothetical protein
VEYRDAKPLDRRRQEGARGDDPNPRPATTSAGTLVSRRPCAGVREVLPLGEPENLYEIGHFGNTAVPEQGGSRSIRNVAPLVDGQKLVARGSSRASPEATVPL